jgi:hypothetical protein
VSGLVSIAEYARHRGVSDAAVHQAIKAGRIEAIDVDGRRWLHPELADRQWRERTQHAKARRKDSASPALERPVPVEPEPALAPDGGVARAEGGDPSYLDAKTRRETALAKLAEIELDRESRRLVSRARVAEAAKRLGRLLRDALLGIPTILAPELAALDDPLAIETRLADALRLVLHDIANLTAQDIEALIGSGAGDSR